jgi:hypothetical protein
VFFFSQICGVGALASLAFFSCGEFVFQKINIISNTPFFNLNIRHNSTHSPSK